MEKSGFLMSQEVRDQRTMRKLVKRTTPIHSVVEDPDLVTIGN
jgi:hypothetical protein